MTTQLSSTLGTYRISDERTYLSRTSIRNGFHFYESRTWYVSRLSGRKKSIQIDVPFSGEPSQRLESDDSRCPDKSPLGSADVGIVTMLVEEDGEEYRPYEQKRPNICVEV